MKNIPRCLIAIVLALTLVTINISAVMADDDKAPTLGDLEKAQKVVPEITFTIKRSDGTPLRVERGGTTGVDIPGGNANGYHESWSDISEDDIRVNGGIKIYGAASWANTNSDWRNNSTFAFCLTSMPNPTGSQTFWAESTHYWNTSGYTPQNGQTSNYAVG